VAGLVAGEVSLSLRVDGYQHGTADNDFDANWLTLSVDVTSNERSWSASAPALSTWEARELVLWLRSVALGTDEGRGFSGLEGMLQFEAIDLDGAPMLTAVFWRGLAPETVKDAEVPVSFAVPPEQIARFADELLAELEPFPIRAVEPDGYASKLLAEGG